jgi:nitronate monooxygenase
MEIPKLKIGNITADIPIVQGGMGVKVSLSSLASAVANEGGIGTIASVGIGDIKTTLKEWEHASREGLVAEIRKARSKTKGHLALNVMGVLSNSDDLVKTAVREGIKNIVFGAGLPFRLPELVEDHSVNLVPIVSSGRGARLILHKWDRRYGRIAEGFILEGPLAGGHLGFSPEQLEDPKKYSIEVLLPEALEAIKPFEDKYGTKIPIIAGGGIYNGKDIARMLSLGASGVQMATRFVCTEECDVSPEFKQAYIDAKEEDIVIIKSPVGMPGRAINNKFLEDVRAGKVDVKCPYKCLVICKMNNSRYCIALALLNSCSGDLDRGLIFCGQNVYRVDKIVTVRELISELLDEMEDV